MDPVEIYIDKNFMGESGICDLDTIRSTLFNLTGKSSLHPLLSSGICMPHFHVIRPIEIDSYERESQYEADSDAMMSRTLFIFDCMRRIFHRDHTTSQQDSDENYLLTASGDQSVTLRIFLNYYYYISTFNFYNCLDTFPNLNPHLTVHPYQFTHIPNLWTGNPTQHLHDELIHLQS